MEGYILFISPNLLKSKNDQKISLIIKINLILPKDNRRRRSTYVPLPILPWPPSPWPLPSHPPRLPREQIFRH